MPSIMKWFDIKKGFGFLTTETGEDVFVHYTVIQGEGFCSLRAGDVVDYDLAPPGPRGLCATRARSLSDRHVPIAEKPTAQYAMDTVSLPTIKTMDGARIRGTVRETMKATD